MGKETNTHIRTHTHTHTRKHMSQRGGNSAHSFTVPLHTRSYIVRSHLILPFHSISPVH